MSFIKGIIFHAWYVVKINSYSNVYLVGIYGGT
jgi:hypothetical protein